MERMDRRARISWLSQLLGVGVFVLACALPLLVFVSIVTMTDQQIIKGVLGTHVGEVALSQGVRLAVVGAALLPALILSAGLFALRPALFEMRSGRPFAGAAFNSLRRFAGALVAGTLLKIAIVPFLSVVISHSMTEGRLVLSLSFVDVQFLVFAALIWLLAWVMAEGHALASENAQFV